jgi:hypothetical protein
MSRALLALLLAAMAVAPSQADDLILFIEGGGFQPLLPDTTVCWSEPPNLEGDLVRSDIVEVYDLEAEVANDFLIEDPGIHLVSVRWWGGYVEQNFYSVESFIFRVYLTDAVDPCLPGDLYHEVIIEGNANETYLDDPYGFPLYEYHAPLSMTPPGPDVYWFVVLAGDHPVPPNLWGRLQAAAVTGCPSVFRSDFFSFPDWIEIEDLNGRPYDASQEFECSDEPTPAEQTSWGGIKALYR